jgi:methionyl-tRNA synthetase
MYVWLDALTNYVSATGWPDPAAARAGFWPADIHFIGKDILRFHAVYWPAFLMAAGLPVPHRVYAHGWWTVEGEKMSKSLGNVIDTRELAATYGLDQVRFFLLREKPFGGDGTISHPAIVNRINVELANGLGNLAQRSLSLIARNCGGKLPPRGAGTADDTALLEAANVLPGIVRERMDRQAFHEALEEIWKVVRAGDGYIDRQAPWALKKTDPARMSDVLRVLVDTLRPIATVLLAFMPGSMARLLDQLGVPADRRGLADLAAPLPDGTALPPPVGVFPRHIDDTPSP